MSPTSQDKDWHRNFQDEDYLRLSLQRLKDDSPPLYWCTQFADIFREQFQGSAGPLSIHDIGCNVGHFCRVLPELQHEVTYRGRHLHNLSWPGPPTVPWAQLHFARHCH